MNEYWIRDLPSGVEIKVRPPRMSESDELMDLMQELQGVDESDETVIATFRELKSRATEVLERIAVDWEKVTSPKTGKALKFDASRMGDAITDADLWEIVARVMEDEQIGSAEKKASASSQKDRSGSSAGSAKGRAKTRRRKRKR